MHHHLSPNIIIKNNKMASGSRQQTTGRIHLYERNTDAETPILGQDVQLSENHISSIMTSTRFEMKDANRRDYRNRINRTYTWLEPNYADYYEVGVRVLTVEEKADPNQFHHKNDHDLVYSGFNVRIFLSFLSEKKIKRKDPTTGAITLMGYDDIRKYHDAILWGSKQANQPLPPEYYVTMESFLKSYRKEVASAKKVSGGVDEQDADPINCTLFKGICKWAVEEGNVFLWAFSLCQWNLVSRACSIDTIGLHNLKKGGVDSIMFKHDSTKTDQSGEFTTVKNCYANPKSPTNCLFLALGCHLTLTSENFSRKSDKLFQRPDRGDGSASQRYGKQLSALLHRNKDFAKVHLRMSHASSHGMRKVCFVLFCFIIIYFIILYFIPYLI